MTWRDRALLTALTRPDYPLVWCTTTAARRPVVVVWPQTAQAHSHSCVLPAALNCSLPFEFDIEPYLLFGSKRLYHVTTCGLLDTLEEFSRLSSNP